MREREREIERERGVKEVGRERQSEKVKDSASSCLLSCATNSQRSCCPASPALWDSSLCRERCRKEERATDREGEREREQGDRERRRKTPTEIVGILSSLLS